MRLYTFKYVSHKEYCYVVVPAYSIVCAQHKVLNKNVELDGEGKPMVVSVSEKELSKDWV